jgi:hypothetical protein
LQPAGEALRHDEPGEVVVGERRMTRVGPDENGSPLAAGQHDLPVAHRPRLERGVHHDLEHAVRVAVEARHDVVGQAEPPAVGEVARAVRRPPRALGKRMAPRLEFPPRHALTDRPAVGDDVEVERRGVHHPPPVEVGDPRATERPLVGDHPFKSPRPGRHFVDGERQLPPEDRQRSTQPLPREAPVERHELRGQPVHLQADPLEVGVRGRRYGLHVS